MGDDLPEPDGDVNTGITGCKRAQQQVAHDLDAMTRLRDLGTLFVQEGNLEAVLTEIVDTAIAIAGADFGNIQLVDPESGILRIAAQRGFPREWLDFQDSGAESQGSCGATLTRGRQVIVEDVEQDPIFAGTPALEILRRAGVRAVQSMPLISRSGELLGMLSTHYRTPHRPNDHTLHLLDLLALQSADILERAKIEKALRQSSAELQLVLDSTASALTHCSRDLRYLSANPAYARLIGLPREQIIGRPIVEVIGEAAFNSIRPYVERVLRGERVEYEEERPISGHSTCIHAVYVPDRDSAGAVVGWVASLSDITARKRTEQALRESEARLQRSQEIAHLGSWELDVMSNRLSWSDEIYRIFGLKPREFGATYEAFLEHVHPEDRQMVDEAYSGSLRENRDTYEIEHRIIRKNTGEIRVVQEKCLHVRDATGKIVRSIGMVQDVTDRHESEARYRLLFESTMDGMALADAATGILLDCNQALCRLVERDKSELTGQHQAVLHPPQELVPGGTRLFRHHLEAPNGATTEDLLLAKSGRTIAVEISTVHVHMGGRHCLLGIFRDLTQRKQAEVERERLSAAIEQAAETIVITDVRGSILYCNPAFEKVSGYTRQEALGRNPRILKSGKHDTAFYKQMWERLTHGEVWAGHLVNQRKDGSLYEEEATISPVRDAGGAIVYYVAVKRDITHEQELASQLRQAQRLESVGRLAGGVAHDFNNLLSVIIGYADFAIDKLRNSDPIREDILEIRQAGQRAAALTRQLLAFSRKQVLEPQVLDLNWVIADLEKMLGRLLGEDIDISLHLTDGVGSVMADLGQIEQVFVNLCVNARDAMPQGGKLTIETVSVELDPEDASVHVGGAAGPYVMLSIIDTGSGMDADTRERIFEPFFTTKERGKGTGLGLSTVYGIIKQSGGNILVSSEPGRGTTFRIYLPRVNEQAVDARPRPAATLATGSETVLIVEDEDMVRGLAERILRQAGYTVLSAANGGEALLLCEKHGAVDLVLTDVVMPLMSGRELAERLAETVPRLKVLYMSGYTDNDIAHYGVLAPGTRFIGKPFSATDLTRKVRETLDEGGGQVCPNGKE